MSGKKHEHPTRACLIISPRSGEDTFKLDEALPVLLAQGWDVDVREKQKKGQAIDLARQAAEDGYDPIVNCGGDGTLNEIVEGLVGSDVSVGVIPGGTENVWSKEICVSARSRVAATQLVASRRVRVDVGRLEINGKHAHHFLMMAGLGADGAVMQRVSRSLKERIGPLAVGVAAVEALPSIQPVAVRADLDGVRWQGRITEMVVGNTRRYGGFTRITPDALMDDGLLDVCLFTPSGALGAGRQMAAMLFRQHPSAASAEFYRAKGAELHATRPLPLQIDGSAIEQKSEGEAQYRFSVVPHGISILVPRTYDGELFEHGMNGSKRSKGTKKGKKG